MVFLAACANPAPASAAETNGPVGKRPYELDWANRTQDAHQPLVEFEELTGWRVEGRNAEARFERTREQQIWGSYVGKLTYRGTGADPQMRLLPRSPSRSARHLMLSRSGATATIGAGGRTRARPRSA